MIKVNFDGAFDSKKGIGAIGIVSRDAEGNFIIGVSEKVVGSLALMIEALALKKGFIISEGYGFAGGVRGRGL